MHKWLLAVTIAGLTLGACGTDHGQYVTTRSPETPTTTIAPTVEQLTPADQAHIEQYFNPGPPPAALTTPPFGCNPNYSGCVPVASDVDCVGGAGDGPAYATDITVTGTDVYRLDPDGNHHSC